MCHHGTMGCTDPALSFLTPESITGTDTLESPTPVPGLCSKECHCAEGQRDTSDTATLPAQAGAHGVGEGALGDTVGVAGQQHHRATGCGRCWGCLLTQVNSVRFLHVRAGWVSLRSRRIRPHGAAAVDCVSAFSSTPASKWVRNESRSCGRHSACIHSSPQDYGDSLALEGTVFRDLDVLPVLQNIESAHFFGSIVLTGREEEEVGSSLEALTNVCSLGGEAEPCGESGVATAGKLCGSSGGGQAGCLLQSERQWLRLASSLQSRRLTAQEPLWGLTFHICDVSAALWVTQEDASLEGRWTGEDTAADAGRGAAAPSLSPTAGAGAGAGRSQTWLPGAAVQGLGLWSRARPPQQTHVPC
nr:uncharacterized protein LOC109730768 [Microcebus murinus]XP_020142502.1 uncharacterized protein LOC109730768 [Microcebus murinus]